MKTRLVRWAPGPLVVFVCALAGCEGTPPPPPDIDAVTWQRYEDDQIGFSLSHPDVYRADDYRHGVLLRHDGFPVVAISFADEREADRRGLWAGHEAAGDTVLSGVAGKHYVYDHWDGPFYMRTVSFVIPWKDRYLALEFRTKNDVLDPVQQRMVDSFQAGEK